MEREQEYLTRRDELSYNIPDWLWERALGVRMNNYLTDALLIIRNYKHNCIPACEVHNRLRILYPEKYLSLDSKYGCSYEKVKSLDVIKANINNELKRAGVPLRIRQDSLKKYRGIATNTYHAVYVKQADAVTNNV